ncbi:hypothetical protein Ancab_015575 [Ancistrocladus abbreviatus]
MKKTGVFLLYSCFVNLTFGLLEDNRGQVPFNLWNIYTNLDLGTPLWRNGPPDKPVLCNACGSRWRTKGTLANYTPLHARVDPDDLEDHKISRTKSISLKKRDERLNKRKQTYDNVVVGSFSQDYDLNFQKNVDEDTSNRSSSGSAISNSESFAQFGSGDMSDLTGPAQSIVWDTMVPSRKRTCITRLKPSPVEKLTKDLYTILHEQQSSHVSGCSEDDLLYESETPMVSVEIGHGSVLIRHPSSMTREEESEASSLSVDNKRCTGNEAYSHSASLLYHKDNKGINAFGPPIEKVKPTGQMMQQEQIKREKPYHERPHILWNNNSPLHCIDLTEIANIDVFWEHLTVDEQQQMLKYLPSDDTSSPPDSLRRMFASPYFKENLSSFQQLLADGIFDNSSSGVKTEGYKTLKRLALSNLSKQWVEQYNKLKGKGFKDSTEGHQVASGAKISISGNLGSAKRLRDGQNQHLPDMKTSIRSPKRPHVKAAQEPKELSENDGSCFSPRSLFALPSDGSSLMLESFQFVDESSDQDLLLDVPSNSSFPQAELLHPASSFASHQPCASSSSIHPAFIHP